MSDMPEARGHGSSVKLTTVEKMTDIGLGEIGI